jgi:predicted nucleotidyltransferase
MYKHDEIMQFIYLVAEVANPDRIILFGSYAYGNPNENSDLDLLVIKNDKVLSRDEHAELAVAVFEKRRQMRLRVRSDISFRTNQQVQDTLEKGGAFSDALQRGKIVYERAPQ